MQYAYNSVVASLSNNLQLHWMAELELYGKVVNINNLFPPNNPHKQNIKTYYCKDSTNMKYSYKSAISSLSNN